MTSDGRRPRRVAEELRAHLGVALRAELADPRLAGIVITRVELGPDLAVGHVFVRLLVGDEDPKRRRGVVRALSGAAARLRRGLGPKLKLRRVPELRFNYDEHPDHRARVEQLLEEIQHDASEEAPHEEAPHEEAPREDAPRED